jgi:endo-1,4-beta-xylanase
MRLDKAKVIRDSPDDTPWEDDSAEFYLDMKRDRSLDYGLDDFQYIVGVGNSRLFETHGRIQAVTFSGTSASAQSLMQLNLPWKLLGAKPRPGMVLGFDAALNVDRDGGTRDQSYQWAGNDQNFRDTSLFGDLKLGSPCQAGAIK